MKDKNPYSFTTFEKVCFLVCVLIISAAIIIGFVLSLAIGLYGTYITYKKWTTVSILALEVANFL